MILSRVSYYADFAVYPPLIAGFATRALWHASGVATSIALVAIALGVAVWTALEYALHRWVLHGVEPFKGLHEQHHAHPARLIGTPVWLSVPLFLLVWRVLARWQPGFVAAALLAGLMMGYLVYTAVHAAVHHLRARPGSWLHRAKLRHARHHGADGNCNFAVSCGIWDRLLGTERASGAARHRSPPGQSGLLARVHSRQTGSIGSPTSGTGGHDARETR